MKLVREECNALTSMDLNVAKIAEEARVKLGYGHLKAAMGHHGLANVLRDLGIDPFKKESIMAYKNKMVKEKSTQWERASWERIDLSCYHRPVPEFVLIKALEIKERLPNAQFFVEELQLQRLPFDPFLVVCEGGDEFYIEVWDEPKFETV